MSPATTPEPPRRVRVTSPRTGALRRRVAGTSEIDAQTQLGEIYMTSLLRAQLRLAALVIVAVVVFIGGLPLAFRLVPTVMDTEVLGMPLSWVLLAFAVYPLLFLLGWLYVRAAERTEQDFADVVERS
jgi:Protein of unknown function, DUF485